MDNLTIIIQFHIKYGHVPLLCQERRRSSYLGRTGVASQEAPVGTGTRSLLGSAVPGIRCCKWISGHSYRAYNIYIYINLWGFIPMVYIQKMQPQVGKTKIWWLIMIDHQVCLKSNFWFHRYAPWSNISILLVISRFWFSTMFFGMRMRIMTTTMMTTTTNDQWQFSLQGWSRQTWLNGGISSLWDSSKSRGCQSRHVNQPRYSSGSMISEH